MPILLEDLKEGHTYVVKMGETTVMTGKFVGLDTKRISYPPDPRLYTVLVAQIVNADQKAVQKVGVYNDTYTFELAAPGEQLPRWPKAAAAAAGGGGPAVGSLTAPAGPGFRAVRALKEGAKGQGRKTKKSKRRSRKTRRTRR